MWFGGIAFLFLDHTKLLVLWMTIISVQKWEIFFWHAAAVKRVLAKLCILKVLVMTLVMMICVHSGGVVRKI